MPVATVEQFKDYLAWKGDANDAFLEAVLNAAVAFVERETGHQFHMENEADTAVEKTFSTYGRRVVPVPDLREVVSAELNGTAIEERSAGDTLGYDLWGEPATSIELCGVTFDVVTRGDLMIEGKWGWDPPPPDIVDACLALGARMVRERAASYADTIADPESGILAYYRQLPPRVHGVIESWTKPRMVIGL